jgi:nicotinate-nucleotide--dimethylbenzimidazole phosphoribosyltransferase
MATEHRYDELLSLVKDRRSVRHFRPDPIPDGHVERMIEIARWAPSGFHSQPWEFVVIRDRTVKDKIAAAVSSGPPAPAMRDDASPPGPGRKPGFADAPVFILLAGDWRARVQFPDRPPRDREHAEAGVFWSSLANAFLYLHLAATSLGLSSQWCTGAARGESGEAVREILGLPECIRTYDMMAVGYPAESPIDKQLRDTREMVHYDACGPEDFRTAEKIQADTRESTEWCVRAH